MAIQPNPKVRTLQRAKSRVRRLTPHWRMSLPALLLAAAPPPPRLPLAAA